MTALCSGKICTIFPEKGALNFWKSCTIALEYSYGLLEFNHIWHENEKQREYLFLGESNISWYVYQYKNQCYMELDQPSGREIHRFRNFYEMFDKVLDEAIKG